ncbi:Photosystem I assembly protein Ycf3 [Pseudobythopirellula maris]|uniref:Photosystem I assembly protein Ycf3 n=1 Tax=Pseudobythopirellula maris TaxID=2527991 RepID=A0A5C5ZVE2_9BACT|nr:tetratricopeptide repeat protein [Pseudobythopirellula maris]TWT91018.1 Photosystem I assembly protein Ycf3 [Pseudobythopirellula maris]
MPSVSRDAADPTEHAHGQDLAGMYTAAMLAEVCGVPTATVRRWERRGRVHATRRLNRLSYYDFREASVARLLAALLAAGHTGAQIDRMIDQLAQSFPGTERPLLELPLVVEGGRLYVRNGDALYEPDGQRRLDFETAPPSSPEAAGSLVLPFTPPAQELPSPSDLEERAFALQAEGDLSAAIDTMRLAILHAESGGGCDGETHFALAEMLYESGDTAAACERYYVALERDPELVEARLNLGCVLAERGRLDLAEGAFRGALELHDNYADAHFYLARALDRLARSDEAAAHWERFLAVAPDSPWSQECRERLARPTGGPAPG